MSVELFFKLKEIDSLTKMRNGLLKSKNEQEDRLNKLNNKRQEAHLQTVKIRQSIVSLNNEMGEIESKIKFLSEQKQRLFDIGGDEKKIAAHVDEISRLEEKGLEILSEIEKCESDLNDNKQFLNGVEKTIQEIDKEVQEDLSRINNEISQIELRKNLLMEELPSDFKTTLQKTTSKNLAHGPFTRIEQGSCYFCRYKISRIDESEIDMQKGLKTCPQCSRIFLPYGA